MKFCAELIKIYLLVHQRYYYNQVSAASMSMLKYSNSIRQDSEETALNT